MKRRHFSIAASAFAALPFAGSSVAPLGREPTFEAEIRKFFSAPHYAIDVGYRYLRAHPEKADRRTLIHDLIGRGDASIAPSGSLATLVSQWQERDFRQGAVVLLDGWVLARAEVSLCALLYLGQKA